MEKSFTEVVAEIEDGKLIAEIDRKLRELTQAVMETRKGGTIKLALKFTPTGKATVVIGHKLEASIPREQYATTFFVGDGGELQRNDPNQPKLDLREPSERPAAPLREVPDDGKVRPLREAAKA